MPLFLADRTIEIYAQENNTTVREVLDWADIKGRTRLSSKDATRTIVDIDRANWLLCSSRARILDGTHKPAREFTSGLSRAIADRSSSR